MDILRARGDTYADVITITDETDVPVDVTGISFILTVDSRQRPTDSTTMQYQLSGAITGTGAVEFAPSAGQADRVGYFYYDIQMTDTAGKIKTLVSGRYVYYQDITK